MEYDSLRSTRDVQPSCQLADHLVQEMWTWCDNFDYARVPSRHPSFVARLINLINSLSTKRDCELQATIWYLEPKWLR